LSFDLGALCSVTKWNLKSVYFIWRRCQVIAVFNNRDFVISLITFKESKNSYYQQQKTINWNFNLNKSLLNFKSNRLLCFTFEFELFESDHCKKKLYFCFTDLFIIVVQDFLISRGRIRVTTRFGVFSSTSGPMGTSLTTESNSFMASSMTIISGLSVGSYSRDFLIISCINLGKFKISSGRSGSLWSFYFFLLI